MDRFFAAKISDALPSIVHVDASSVADFFWESSQNAFGSEDYINCAPPWKAFALHFPHPKNVKSNNKNDELDTLRWKQFLSVGIDSKSSYAFVFIEKGKPGNNWGMVMMLFSDSLHSPGSSQIMPVATGEVALEPDGTISKNDADATFIKAYLTLAESHGAIIEKTPRVSDDQIARPILLSHPVVRARVHRLDQGQPGFGEIFMRSLNVLADMACLVITFLHCKNISMADIACPPARDKKGKKYRNRLQEKQIETYKVLEISPFRKAAIAQNGGTDPGLKKALHICRGHFKTYTPEKPLLGRHTGTFWFPQHVKGNPEQGTVTKDYRVGPLS